MSLRSASSGATLLLLLLGASSLLASTDPPIDATTGVLDGQTALAIFPLRYEGREAVEVLETQGCLAHLKSRTSFEILERACGEWFLVPPDRYDVWVERGWQISTYSSKLIYNGGPFGGKGLVGGAPLGPGGRIELPQGFERSKNWELRLLHLGSPSIDGLLRGTISRRLSFDQVGAFQLMPSGSTLAAVWDRRAERYVMLSRPFHLPRETQMAPPLAEPPAERAHLIAQVVRHERTTVVEEDRLNIALVVEGRKIEPAVRLGDADRVYAVWYDLEPGRGELLAETNGAELEQAVSVDLAAGRIGKAVGKMVESESGPTLEIEVELPASMSEEVSILRIKSMPGDEVVRETMVGPERRRFGASNLPTGIIVVELETSLGSFQKFVDLSDGANDFIRIAPELIELSGTVFVGGKETAAKIEIMTISRQTLELSADTDGRFHVTTLEPIRVVSVDAFDGKREPFVEIFFDPIDRSQDLDFEVPDNRFEVMVVDTLTGQPIPGATVVSKNRYQLEDGEETREKAITQSAVTDDEGRASLPSLRPGTAELTAESEDYLETEAVVFQIEAADEGRLLELRLRPRGATAELFLKLPAGTPAAQAAVFVVAGDGMVLSEDRADLEGRAEVAVTEDPGARLLARHPSSAFLIEPWSAAPGDTTTRTMPIAAPPLRLRVLDAWGEAAVPHARLALWSDGSLLAERTLLRLTGQRPLTDEHGFWTVENLPLGPVAVSAWSSGSPEGAEMARMRSMATNLTPPWPDNVEIRLLGDL